MRRVELTTDAISDIENIVVYTIQTFGVAQAALYHERMFEQFDLLSDFPEIGLQIPKLDQKFFKFNYGSHIIIYSFDNELLIIRRILHQAMDIFRHL